MTIFALIIGAVALVISVIALIVAINQYCRLKAKLYAMERGRILSDAIKALDELPEKIYRERCRRHAESEADHDGT